MSLRCEMSRERKLKLSLVESYNKANIFLCLIEYELNSLLGASHLVDYISVHIRFDLERYLLNMLGGVNKIPFTSFTIETLGLQTLLIQKI